MQFRGAILFLLVTFSLSTPVLSGYCNCIGAAHRILFGKCEQCNEGYSGSNCDSCEAGYYRDVITNNAIVCRPCPDRCITCTYRCTKCDDGYHGDTCKERCPDGCLENKCQISGVCSLGCKENYYGDYCEPCYNCLNAQCDKNGNCTDGCSNGFFGQECTRCSPGCRNGVCNKTDGSCSCNSLYTGKMCDSCLAGWYRREDGHCGKCYTNCQSCTSYYRCSICQTGHFGEYCFETCPVGCLHECDEKGMCIGECKDPFYGDKCDQICNENCTYISDSSRCYRSNGTCKSWSKANICSYQCDADVGEEKEHPIEMETMIGIAVEEKEQPIKMATMIGIIIGVNAVIVAVTILTGIAVVRRRLRSIEKSNSSQNSHQSMEHDVLDITGNEIRGAGNAVYEDLTGGANDNGGNYDCISPANRSKARGQIDSVAYINLPRFT